MNEGKDVLHDVIHFNAEKEDIEVEIAIQYNAGYTETIASFVNSIPTRGGVRMKQASKPLTLVS